MATNLIGSNSIYGIGQGVYEIVNGPFIANRAPTSDDKAGQGQVWIYPAVNMAWTLVNNTGTNYNWQLTTLVITASGKVGIRIPGGAALFSGSGVPSFAAQQGDLYTNTSASTAATRLYVNSNGSTTWVHFTANA